MRVKLFIAGRASVAELRILQGLIRPKERSPADIARFGIGLLRGLASLKVQDEQVPPLGKRIAGAVEDANACKRNLASLRPKLGIEWQDAGRSRNNL